MSRHLSGTEKFLKNLPQLPQLPRSKLNEKRLNFEVCGSLVDLNLPRFCRICRVCPRRDRLRDEPEALQYPASVGLVRFDSEEIPE